MNPNSKMLVGAVVAAALAIAVYYGLINQQTASNIQTQANQTLGTAPASQQAAPPASQTAPAPAPQTPASNGTVQPNAPHP